ncbi:Protein disulfide isomerase-like 1-2 [Porphyridium purpureum]|uniref:Protein disulfide isomerase-like 1-2 n=1 Tax=Porphyridium purpureum TaxID=35688 RepID=A0A5J4Z8Y2_PORPP|nr:Protein disulfide isomerase-like 1-2 [Porphyridium purpureum]|eukprot:POR1976..scf295_1
MRMSIGTIVALLVALVASSVRVEGGAIPLSASNATELFSASELGDVWLIEFFSPGCGHCRKFAASYDAVAERLHNEDEPVRVHVAKVDVNLGRAEKEWFRAYGLPGYPSFVRIEKHHAELRGGSNLIHVFSGSRSVEAMVNFARSAEHGKTLDEREREKQGDGGKHWRTKIVLVASSVLALALVLLIAIQMFGPQPILPETGPADAVRTKKKQ